MLSLITNADSCILPAAVGHWARVDNKAVIGEDVFVKVGSHVPDTLVPFLALREPSP
jgi:hypothetical protein